MMAPLDLLEGLAILGMGVAIIGISVLSWRDRTRIERAALAFLVLAGCAALVWKGPSFVGLDEDDFPVSEGAETAFFFLLASAFFVWSSALLARHAGMLERSLDAEREAVAQKQMYLDILGHDVRNPLTAAMLQLEVVAVKNETARPSMAKMKQSLERINKIVADSLLYSKVDDADLAAGRTAQLADVARLALGTAEVVAAAKRVQLALDAPPALDVRVHPLFQHALENLISNAVKWSPEGGVVTLRIGASAGGACDVAVVDHGPGVPADVKPTLFRRFERGRPGGVGGTGLGLAIAGRIVEAHGARVRIEDTPGGGATFVLSLPPAPSRDGRAAGSATGVDDVVPA